MGRGDAVAQSKWVAATPRLRRGSSAGASASGYPNAGDAAVFAFTDVAGSLGSVFFAILLLANVIMQFSFIFIIWYGLLDPNISDKDVNNIKDWRRQLAHSIKYYDELSGESLARRVCNQDFGLEVAGCQQGGNQTACCLQDAVCSVGRACSWTRCRSFGEFRDIPTPRLAIAQASSRASTRLSSRARRRLGSTVAATPRPWRRPCHGDAAAAG